MARLIFFLDFDDTLASNSWKAAAEYYGIEDELGILYRLYMTGEIDDRELMSRTLKLVGKKYRKGDEEKILEIAKLRSYAKKLVETLKAFGDVAILSNGFSPVVRYAAKLLGIEQVFDSGFDPETCTYTQLITPERKAEIIREFKQKGYFVIYIADNAYNDRLAKEEADYFIEVRRDSTFAEIFSQVLNALDKNARPEFAVNAPPKAEPYLVLYRKALNS